MSKHSSTPDKTIHAGALYEKTASINVSTESRISSAVIGSWLLRDSLAHWGRRSNLGRMLGLGAAGYLLYRGLSGNCPLSAALGVKGKNNRSINIRETFIVQRPKEIVYYACRQLEDLAGVLTHVKDIRVLDARRSHWVIDTPKGLPGLEWDAEIVEDREGEMFSWRSLPGSSVETAGKMTLRDFPGDATQVKLMISYRPPAGAIGQKMAQWMAPSFEKMIREDIARFQEYIERFQASMVL